MEYAARRILCTADTRTILRQATENYMITAAEAVLATGLETTSQPDAVSRFASIISHSVQPLLYPELNIADGLVSRRLALIEDFMEAPIIYTQSLVWLRRVLQQSQARTLWTKVVLCTMDEEKWKRTTPI